MGTSTCKARGAYFPRLSQVKVSKPPSASRLTLMHAATRWRQGGGAASLHCGMAAVRQIGKRNQLTLPASVLVKLGLRAGDWVEVKAEGTGVVLRPKLVEDPYSEDDLHALDQLVRRQRKAGQYRDFRTTASALRHLRRLGR